MDRLLMGIHLYDPLASKIYLCIYAGPAKTWLLCQVIPYSVWKNRGMLFLVTYRVCSKNYALGDSGMILCMCPAKERWRYSVTPSLIGWAHTQYDPRYPEKKMENKSHESPESWYHHSITKQSKNMWTSDVTPSLIGWAHTQNGPCVSE